MINPIELKWKFLAETLAAPQYRQQLQAASYEQIRQYMIDTYNMDYELSYPAFKEYIFNTYGVNVKPLSEDWWNMVREYDRWVLLFNKAKGARPIEIRHTYELYEINNQFIQQRKK